MQTVKARYVGSGLFEYNGKLHNLFTLSYVKLKPNQEYFITLDGQDIIEILEVKTQ